MRLPALLHFVRVVGKAVLLSLSLWWCFLANFFSLDEAEKDCILLKPVIVLVYYEILHLKGYILFSANC